ncbi:hypothetical protein EKO27_g2595 [Xylaria grammica]|uniref:WSC domain-containing protein n=1 Tax=Xylaria grammica TaxID=363999 RepID=A0A439DDN1_9PEZI|nr:hypothetical protein EKO27_g2595 [Xylaria grammica]
MARSRYIGPFLAIVALVASPLLVQSLTIEYCASDNTAATATNSSIWQSNGLCHDFCVDKSYAFAILQEHDCWCSNYIPAESSQVDTDECNDSCPGWQEDTCGATGLYGYIALDTSPSGTADASSSTSTSTDKSSTTSTTHETTSPTTPTTSVKTVTAGGTVSLETVTVTPTSAIGSGAGSDTGSGASTGQSGLSSGATAGIAIGVVAIVAILAGIGAFVYLQRKKHQHEEELASRPHSHLSGSQGVMSTPTTTMASVWDGGENMSTGRRSSRLMPHDPRMDPFATNIYTRFENKSRESINTLQDNQDYSRKVLRTTNPDPPNE